MGNVRFWISIGLVIALFLILVMALTGCNCEHYKKKITTLTLEKEELTAAIAATPEKIIYKTVAKQDWLVTLSIIGIGISIFAFLSGQLWGLKSIAALWSVMSIVFMIQRFAVWLAAISLAGAVAIMIFAIWQNRKMLTEIVAGGERFKGIASPPGISDFKLAQNAEQTSITKKVVAKIQTKLNGKE